MRKIAMIVSVLAILSANANAGTWNTVPNLYGGWTTSYCSYCYSI